MNQPELGSNLPESLRRQINEQVDALIDGITEAVDVFGVSVPPPAQEQVALLIP